MNLHQLKALDALARHRTCLQAAKALGVSQPAVSTQLRKLQEACGAKLFERWGRQVEFSRLGEILVLKARTILRLLDDFEATIGAASRLESGQLSIGLSCHYFVMQMLAAFMQRHPGVGIHAQIGDSITLIEDVLACRLDLAEVTAAGPDPRLYNLAYSRQRIVLFVAGNHPWAMLPEVPAPLLHGQAMVARHATSMTRRLLEQRLHELGVAPRVVMELDTWETVREAVAAGIGFGIALEEEFSNDERLRRVRLSGVDLSARQYFVCLPEFKHLRTVQTFLDLVQEFIEKRGEVSDRPRSDAAADRSKLPNPIPHKENHDESTMAENGESADAAAGAAAGRPARPGRRAAGLHRAGG
jgi:DNA-binding transcriptional LysR family regulator